MRARELAIGPVPCLALRVTYVGELGWELYCPTEFGLALWDAIWDSGRAARPRRGRLQGDRLLPAREGLPGLGRGHHAGRHARTRPGLGFAVKLDKGDFIGRDALLERARAGRRLACLVLDDPRSVALGSEPVRVDGRLVGRVTSGGYGYTVDRSIAYAYLPAGRRRASGTPVEVEIFGDLGRRRGRRRALVRPGRIAAPFLAAAAH